MSSDTEPAAVFVPASDLIRALAVELCDDCTGETYLLLSVDPRGSPRLGPLLTDHSPTCPTRRAALTNRKDTT